MFRNRNRRPSHWWVRDAFLCWNCRLLGYIEENWVYLVDYPTKITSQIASLYILVKLINFKIQIFHQPQSLPHSIAKPSLRQTNL